jgi:hypothetical protein
VDVAALATLIMRSRSSGGSLLRRHNRAIPPDDIIRLRAERRAGELLLELKKTGRRHVGKVSKGSTPRTPTNLPKLADLSVTKQQASRWQKLAAERRAGELLLELKKTGRRANKQKNLKVGTKDPKSTKRTSENVVPKLADLGVTKQQASRWQRIAAVPAAASCCSS